MGELTGLESEGVTYQKSNDQQLFLFLRHTTKFKKTRKHSSRMHSDRAVTKLNSEPVSMRPIVDRQTPMKTLTSLAVGKKHRNSGSDKGNVINIG